MLYFKMTGTSRTFANEHVGRGDFNRDPGFGRSSDVKVSYIKPKHNMSHERVENIILGN